jgi:hypothetical protein
MSSPVRAANGVPNYPYPNGDTTNFQGTGVDPNSPSVERISLLCAKKMGLPASMVDGTYSPGSVEVRTAGSPLNPTPPPCFYRANNPCSGDITLPPGATPPGGG